jgi:hypothetical protein
MTLIGTGVSLNNARAVLEGLFFSGGKFIRTPKFGTFHRDDLRARVIGYGLKMDLLPYFEFALGAYALLALNKAMTTSAIVISPFLFMYTCGFFYISFRGIGESLDWTIGRFRSHSGTKPSGLEEQGGI